MNAHTLNALASGEPIYTLSEVASLVARARMNAAREREEAVLEAVEAEVENLREEIAEFAAGAAVRLAEARVAVSEAARSAVDSAEFARQGWAEVERLRRAVDTHRASPCAKSTFDRDLYEVAAR